jgi:poly(A) polymerase
MRALGRIHLPQPLPPSAYLVGGAVRDLWWGQRPADFDLVCAQPQQLAPQLAAQWAGQAFELDAARQHWRVVAPAGHHDLAPLYQSLEADLGRRDYTINALAASHRGAVYGLPMAAHDLKHRILRAVRRHNLWDDPLRSLRGIRLATCHQLTIEPRTWGWLTQHAQHLSHQKTWPAWERVGQELNRLMLSPHAPRGWRLLEASGLLEVYLPELARGVQTWQGGFHQHTVWHHCIQTLALLLQLYPNAPLALRWAALLHDLGKPDSQQPHPAGRGFRFLGHAQLGSHQAQELLERLRQPRELVVQVADLIRHHMERPQGEEKTVRRYLFRHRSRLPGLGWLLQADLGSIAGIRSELPQLQATLGQIEAWRTAQPDPRPLLTGHQIMELLGIEPGPQVGRMMHKLLQAQALGKVSTTEEAQQFIRAQVPARRAPHTGSE